jgi:hypothetical protein
MTPLEQAEHDVVHAWVKVVSAMEGDIEERSAKALELIDAVDRRAAARVRSLQFSVEPWLGTHSEVLNFVARKLDTTPYSGTYFRHLEGGPNGS